MNNRRTVFYLAAGMALCAAGVVVMFIGVIGNRPTEQLAGILLCGAAVPLLLQAKLNKIESRIDQLEEELKNRRPEI